MSNDDPKIERDAAKTEPRPRGFAALSPERRRELARRGGQRAHELGRANKFSSDDASAAGRIPHLRGTAYRRPKRTDAPSEPVSAATDPSEARIEPEAVAPDRESLASTSSWAARGPSR